MDFGTHLAPVPSPIRRNAIRLLCVAATVALAAAGPARAEDRWSVRSGQFVFNFNTDLLHDMGLELKVDANGFEPTNDVAVEEPAWTFPIVKGSDLGFRTEYAVIQPGSLAGTGLRLGGAFALRDLKSGRTIRLDNLAMARTGATERGSEVFQLRGGLAQQRFCDLVHSMLNFRPKEQAFKIHYLNARITESWARAIGRPEIAGLFIGGAEVRSTLQLVSSTPPVGRRYQPNFTNGTLDVGLGILDDIQQVGHVGTFPTGTAGLALATTICNFGDVDVPWLAPMEENHPLIHMALYRLLNGRFEQVGVSWMKHGFFATSFSDCSTCQDPSDGTYLGIGCSDTYSVSNNSNRAYLGPRSEVNPYTAVWTCTGSHFSGGVQDCVRRHGSSGHNAVDHRLIVADGDLNNPGATYYYEGCYFVRNDVSLTNNWGSRSCTMSWNGSMWTFATPSSGNPLINGPAIGRWGEMATTVPLSSDDGQVTLAVQTTHVTGNTYHYEYALLNRNANRQVRSFSIPAYGVSNITNLGFHDNDNNATNDWTVSITDGVITWQTSTYAQDQNANALVFGNMMNFRFDADAQPANHNASLGIFKPGASFCIAATRTPTFSNTGVEPGALETRSRLIDMRPNPFSHRTTISYELAAGGRVTVEIYDAAGRLVRTLLDESEDPGVHSVVWDGNGVGGRSRAGVYHARMRVGNTTSVKPLVLVN